MYFTNLLRKFLFFFKFGKIRVKLLGYLEGFRLSIVLLIFIFISLIYQSLRSQFVPKYSTQLVKKLKLLAQHQMASLISIKTSVANLKRSFIRSSEVTFWNVSRFSLFIKSPGRFCSDSIISMISLHVIFYRCWEWESVKSFILCMFTLFCTLSRISLISFMRFWDKKNIVPQKLEDGYTLSKWKKSNNSEFT